MNTQLFIATAVRTSNQQQQQQQKWFEFVVCVCVCVCRLPKYYLSETSLRERHTLRRESYHRRLSSLYRKYVVIL
jgi:hypothetical protein